MSRKKPKAAASILMSLIMTIVLLGNPLIADNAYAASDGVTKYRAILIGNSYDGTDVALDGPQNDVMMMVNTLTKSDDENKDLANGFELVRQNYNANASKITSEISVMKDQADEDDVTVFYFSGHGMVSDDENNGALCAYDSSGYTPYTLEQLSTQLLTIPGKIIVLLDCCGSGAAVKSKSALSKSVVGSKIKFVTPEDPETVDAFNDAVINTFAEADVVVPGSSASSGSVIPKSNEFPTKDTGNKFHVLTACDINTLSNSIALGSNDEYLGLFTMGICWAGGYDQSIFYGGYMSFFDADYNTDNKVTWTELSKYMTEPMSDFSEFLADALGSRDLIQRAQCYPTDGDDDLVVFEANSFDIANIPDTGIAAKTYTGKALKPAKMYRGMIHDLPVLVPDEDYTATYTNNKNVGKAKVTIEGQGKYYGSFTASFNINPKGTSLKSLKAGKKCFTAKWAKQATKMSKSRITGYEIRYSTYSSMKKAKTVKATKYSTTSKKISKLKAKKKYYVQVRTYMKVSGKTYYSSWSKKKTVKTR